MNASTHSIIRETAEASAQGRIHFGQVVGRLADAGVDGTLRTSAAAAKRTTRSFPTEPGRPQGKQAYAATRVSLSDAMSITKRYFTSFFTSRS